MKCLQCDPAVELIRDTRDLSYTYKGERTLISSVTGDFCPACEEVVLERAEFVRGQCCQAMLAFNKLRSPVRVPPWMRQQGAGRT